MLARKHVISATLVLNDIFHCCPMIITLITLVSVLATPWEYWTYLVVFTYHGIHDLSKHKSVWNFHHVFCSSMFWDTESCKNPFHVTSARITPWRFNAKLFYHLVNMHFW